ncbi:leucine--tRNA ligase [Ochrovirga pacifica]|uniref:leucine--tRNA ligase n=1 Tax=Ochrovirga pacifica TaxID=1042376 RepID=UPI000255A4FD|nr:class I tRNA ligase family protein [Ochrovirga pacifica]
MEYNFNEIEAKWQKKWADNQTFKAENNSDKPKFYVLDMFPYPSGAGLHVGHPLGYIASDIFARYKRHKGFNVLHPQGYDSFGLPAEQYAIQTGQHPAITTETNINTYRKQLDKIGFSFDWSREIRTSTPEYYKHTQWIFTELFNAWYNKTTDKAEKIETLIALFEADGTQTVNAACDEDVVNFTAQEWNAFSTKEKEQVLAKYRLTYLSETEVNWCPALGTVLANDEIINGLSERGGHPVVRKKMMQWSMRISAYAQRLLDGLNTIDWPQPLKDAQTNWIGRSQGASVHFKIEGSDEKIEVFTTRPDTIFGVTFMTLAPEHELVSQIVTHEQKEAVEAYIEATAKRSERERMADVKTISGVFTGAYAVHPFTGENIPIWLGDYVLASYGTGAVMAVPCGDQRDYDFAKHFNIPIKNIFEGVDISEKACEDKTAKIANSDFLSGLNVKKATKLAIYELEKAGFGQGKINYRLRDAVFSRQRYWGEPFPVYYVDGMPQMIAKEHLPVVLPEVEKYLPTEDGQPPLGNAEVWAWSSTENKVVSNELIDNEAVFPLELNTMPGWAGSSWYFNRYMDANNENEFASKEALDYWKEVDLYLGGSEHATGHLLYARFWQKFLYDLNYVPVDEFAKKLINQGMITGTSAFVHYAIIHFTSPSTGNIAIDTKRPIMVFYSKNTDLEKYVQDNFIKDSDLEYTIEDFKRHVDVVYVNSSDELNIKEFESDSKYSDLFSGVLEFSYLLENDKYITTREVEKMSKSKFNVVNPDAICEQYGADSLRLFEMFLGPLEQSKPWNTAGISGSHSFLKKLWRLYANANDFKAVEGAPTKDELKVLHKTIKKVEEDIENFSFNTSVSTFMIAVNELSSLKCNKKEILEPLLVLISPYAPHITEELWERLGNTNSIAFAPFPTFDASHLVENSKEYPISFNGKMRFKLELPLDLSKEEIEKTVMAHEKTQAQLQGRTPKKVIVVPGKIINIVG